MSEKQDELERIARLQGGYFTRRQAIECGFGPGTHAHHVRRGTWQHLTHGTGPEFVRGIYRFRKIELGPSDDLHSALMWTWTANRDVNKEGVVSHESALAVYDLSDLMASRIHLTVPATFRRHSEAPDRVVLHRVASIADMKDYIWEWDGLRVTSPYQTVVDLIHEGRVSLEHVESAYRQARTGTNKKITQQEADTLTNLTENQKEMVAKWESSL